MYYYIAISTLLIYFVLAYLDQQRNLRQHKPPTTLAMKLVFAFFACVISIIAFQFFNLAGITSSGGAATAAISMGSENNHLKNIVADVQVGLPTF